MATIHMGCTVAMAAENIADALSNWFSLGDMEIKADSLTRRETSATGTT